jgi:hypothetical protein
MAMRARPGTRLALSVLVLFTAAACTRPLPPVASVGDPVIGPNPATEPMPGTRTSVMSYGPWTVPAATGPGHDQAGMIEDVKYSVRRPCTDCFVTAARPQLRYLDGTVANTDTGLWLHHFAQLSSAGIDTRCGATEVQLLGEVLFTGANERTGGRFPAGAGYRVGPLDRWALLVDLMNTGPTARQVTFEMTYEWVPASTPGMHRGRPVFMDVGQACVDSTFPAETGKYSRKNTWTVSLPGRLLGVAGHLHDGGTHITLRNLTTGQLICDSKAYYGGPGYEEAAGAGAGDGHDHGSAGHAGVHLSAMDQCVSRGIDRPLAVIKRGEQLEIEAFYDADAHPHMAGEPVMGLVFMYVLPEG